MRKKHLMIGVTVLFLTLTFSGCNELSFEDDFQDDSKIVLVKIIDVSTENLTGAGVEKEAPLITLSITNHFSEIVRLSMFKIIAANGNSYMFFPHWKSWNYTPYSNYFVVPPNSTIVATIGQMLLYSIMSPTTEILSVEYMEDWCSPSYINFDIKEESHIVDTYNDRYEYEYKISVFNNLNSRIELEDGFFTTNKGLSHPCENFDMTIIPGSSVERTITSRMKYYNEKPISLSYLLLVTTTWHRGFYTIKIT